METKELNTVKAKQANENRVNDFDPSLFELTIAAEFRARKSIGSKSAKDKAYLWLPKFIPKNTLPKATSLESTLSCLIYESIIGNEQKLSLKLWCNLSCNTLKNYLTDNGMDVKLLDVDWDKRQHFIEDLKLCVNCGRFQTDYSEKVVLPLCSKCHGKHWQEYRESNLISMHINSILSHLPQENILEVIKLLKRHMYVEK